MLEKIKNPGPSEKFPEFPVPIYFPLTFQVFQGAWQPCITKKKKKVVTGCPLLIAVLKELGILS